MDENDSIEARMEAGFAALRDEQFEEAVGIGRELIGMRHTSGFEIAGVALERLGRVDEAIGLLEQGVTKASGLSVLWKLLGDCYSDAVRFEDAEKAYATALTKEDVDEDLVELNRGIAFTRQEKWGDAERAFEKVKAKRIWRFARAELIRVALGAGNMEMAARRARELAESGELEEENYDRRTRASILCAIALGLWEGKDFAGAKEYALTANQLHRANEEALGVVREANGKRAIGATGYQLILDGKLDVEIDGERPDGFFTTVNVVAQDIDAALDYAYEFFPEEVRRTLRIDEVNEFDAAEVEFEGVYFISGYGFYSSEPDRNS